ncbi:Hypp2827 [Branchiostoma lanceolatum]|uniref:Hypp2827 protein n=1 Tax=Branchiostoma lanceolatum TaxID=7740 RepID=A0A8J9ZUX8_BRALA|nr:Hypp2827 [Branchiostoma lanceolatum]
MTNGALLAMKHKGRRDVKMLTTAHSAKMVDTDKRTRDGQGSVKEKSGCKWRCPATAGAGHFQEKIPKSKEGGNVPQKVCLVCNEAESQNLPAPKSKRYGRRSRYQSVTPESVTLVVTRPGKRSRTTTHGFVMTLFSCAFAPANSVPQKKPAAAAGKTIISLCFMTRMDLIDMTSRPDEDHKWILHMRDHFTKELEQLTPQMEISSNQTPDNSTQEPEPSKILDRKQYTDGPSTHSADPTIMGKTRSNLQGPRKGPSGGWKY